MKQTAFRVDPEIHQALRIAAIKEGISMNQAVTEAIDMWLKSHKEKAAKARKERG